MTSPGRYSDDLDVLTALVTYLALTPKRSRTPTNLAKDLSLAQDDVVRVFRAFPGLFRRSVKSSEAGEHYYTLHARYALRHAEDNGTVPQVGPELLRNLIEFISQRAAAEAAVSQSQLTLRQANRNTVIAAISAVVAAVASIGSAIVG